MFAIVSLDRAGHWLAFKAGSEDFAELIDRPGIIPAPYLARAEWVALEGEDAIGIAELKVLLRKASDLIFARLTRKQQVALAAPPTRGRARGA
jgi:predicted DNA-binding protein (MmcQ/YjbR family)